MAILTNLKKEDFNKILNNYNLDKYKSHKHLPQALGNTVYLLKTTKNKFILKIFEKSDPKFIQFQIKVMKLFENSKLPSPKIIPTKNNKSLLIYNENRIMIQEFVEGKTPKTFSNALIKNIAQAQGKMNTSLLKLELKGEYTWGKDYQFSPIEFGAYSFGNFNIKNENKLFLKELKNLNKNKLKRSIIHGDFHSANMLVKKDKVVTIIDLDDIHEDFLVQEVSNFIAHTFIGLKSIKKDQMEIYIREYEKHVKLNEEEKKAIYFFIKHRFLSVIGWHLQQLKKHMDQKESIEKIVIEHIKLYKSFSKISLNDFIRMF